MATEKRLIDANEALEKIKALPDLQYFAEWYVDYDGVCNVLKNAPTVDAVEVVRCQHCQEYDALDNGLHYCKFFSKILGDAYYIPSPDGYCDRGKRRSCDEG